MKEPRTLARIGVEESGKGKSFDLRILWGRLKVCILLVAVIVNDVKGAASDLFVCGIFF